MAFVHHVKTKLCTDRLFLESDCPTELDFNGRSSGSSSLKRLPAPGAVALVFEKKKGHTAAGLHGILTRFPFHRTMEGCETVVGAKIGLFVLAKNFLQHFF
jgi:hypothetical protein